ncbi:hypothetical protein Bca4012_007282 [Brassica carinata]|uniref:(rape) hypothetical protein n=1 Tax=Brassica napus TaxID=3708 RepID=A0A816IFH5_BRANA|nr:unnamed protein product [Brassica napus]
MEAWWFDGNDVAVMETVAKKKLTIVLFPLTATPLRHLSRSRFFRHSIKRFIVSPLLQSFISISLTFLCKSCRK